MPKSIAIGLVKAQAYARGVEKLGKNTQGRGYAYARSEDIIAEGRKALIEGGRIGFAVLGWGFEPAGETGPARTKVKDGETKTLATASGRINVRYVLVSLDEGDVYHDTTSAPVVPEFGRPDDKAEYGALTLCHAYTLRGLLDLPRGVEGEVDINQRDDGDPDDDPRDRRADYAPRDERPPSDRPSAEAPRSGARAAADRAVEAQTRGPVAQVPTHDPAHLAHCNDFVRRARVADIGEGREEPGDVFAAAMKSGLPKAFRDRVLVEVFRRAFALAEHPDDLDGFVQLAISAEMGEGEKETLRALHKVANARIEALAAIPDVAA
jgi:hypothetical protein